MSERTIEILQLDGGCHAFDFTNTLNTRRTAPAHDYLGTYDDLLAWGSKTGLLPLSRIKVLDKLSHTNKQGGELALTKAKNVREVLYRLFSEIGKNKSPGKETLDEFNAALSACLSQLRLNVNAGEATPDFGNESPSLDEPLCVVVKSAYDILTQEDFSRLKECPSCGWLFIDRTKNGKRKWCDMQVCGSQDKAKRYYHRKKKGT